MSSFVAHIIFDLLQYRRASIAQTETFSKLTHNKDLCPRFQNKIELVLESYRNYQQITYDIQGLRDNGSDIIIRPQTNEESEFICLQVKSEWDLNQEDYIKTLKAQAFESQRTYERLLDYYIVVCCDLLAANKESRKRHDQIRTISAEFATAKNVHVIEPQFALGFLQLTSIQIDAAIKAKLGVDDVVFREAAACLVDYLATARAVLFRILVMSVYEKRSSLKEQEILDSTKLREIYVIVPDIDPEYYYLKREVEQYDEDLVNYADDDPDSDEELFDGIHDDLRELEELGKERGYTTEARLAIDLDILDGVYIKRNDDGGYSVMFEAVESLIALTIDARIRYKYSGDELIEYLMDLFGPMEDYNPPSDIAIQ